MSSREQHRQVTVRHAPRLVPFLVVGAAVGVVAAVVMAIVTGPTEGYSTLSSAGFLAVVLGLPGLALGAVAWLIAERRTRGRGRTYDAVPRESGSGAAPTERNSAHGQR